MAGFSSVRLVAILWLKSAMIDVSSHALESLGQDAEFVLYRGQRETDPSRILVLVPVLKRPAQGTLRRLF
jgi:hypothetical protein